MVQKETLVKNKTGLHARPAAQLVALCKKFQSKITVTSGDVQCDGKSIFSVLHGCIKQGSMVTVAADGPDAEEAVAQVVAYIDALEE